MERDPKQPLKRNYFPFSLSPISFVQNFKTFPRFLCLSAPPLIQSVLPFSDLQNPSFFSLSIYWFPQFEKWVSKPSRRSLKMWAKERSLPPKSRLSSTNISPTTLSPRPAPPSEPKLQLLYLNPLFRYLQSYAFNF